MNLDSVYDSQYGHRLSVEKQESVDFDGSYIPWYTYSAISYVENLDLSNCSVFEWGAGSSTLFFAQRANKIFSVEFKREWYLKIKKKINTLNVKLQLIDDEKKYISSISNEGSNFDIICIDGESMLRSKMASEAIKYIKKTGMIIFDNSDWYPGTLKILRNHGFIQVDMAGPGPINKYFWCTSFLYKRDFNIRPINGLQPKATKGGRDVNRDIIE